MNVLLVNKFLYPKGGAETYVIRLGKLLSENGHNVSYFGLRDEKNVLSNSSDLLVSNIDLNSANAKNLFAPFRIIYCTEARKKIRKLLYEFEPDVVHLNNIQFHITPSVILEVSRYRKKTGRKVNIVYTAHDYQLVCPSHGLFDPQLKVCEKCLDGSYIHCVKQKCVKNSFIKSIIGAVDGYFWRWSRAYDEIDTIICPSAFLKDKLDTQKRFASKTVTVYNFVDKVEHCNVEKEDYVLEFGHLSKEKGTYTLLEAAKRMPEYRFVFAGYGEAQNAIEKLENAEYVGFKTGYDLRRLIQKAKCSVYPSEWYENCPFSVIESQQNLTPVLGSRMGGIPEIIKENETGLLFEAGNSIDLENKLRHILEGDGVAERFSENCKRLSFETAGSYLNKLIEIYRR